jgi:hypothetical protein
MKNPIDTSYPQRRKHARIPFSLDVDWGETSACFQTGRVTSLSIGGCFLQTPLDVAKGKLLFIRLLLAPGSERASEGLVRGEVIYQLPDLGLGIKFNRLPAGYGKHIEDIVEFHLSSDENE